MQTTTRVVTGQRTASNPVTLEPAKALYQALLVDHPGVQAQERARLFLDDQLQAVAGMSADLPEDSDGLEAWVLENNARVGAQYRDYLAARKAGAPRRYFGSKAHALYFLRGVAPTKLVDGAWLYGTLAHWDDLRYRAAIQIYLEELGDGQPDKNHVVLYRKLLASHGCEDFAELSDDHYVQGAIQLALAHNADHYLPEVLGFNLGYEQLPLHLLITSYELNELGIDPYYFTLHVTVDNAGTGHARKALQAVHDAMPADGRAAFYQRVVQGYLLNELGASTTSVIAGFDLEQAVIEVLAEKSSVGRYVHSDYCRIGGRSVSDWLYDPAQIPDFLAVMQEQGWIKRHEDPTNSRFWRLIQGERAEMFGVFTAYEQQLIHDWIAGDFVHNGARKQATGERVAVLPRREVSFRARQRQQERLCPALEAEQGGAANASRAQASDFDSEEAALEQRLASQPSRAAAMALLVEQLSPARHHSRAGLLATRLFVSLLG
ncbi:iron-containing redox enzyme family protein [Pseudomonas oryzihabitans]|uniref:iron-containing redox enzyme family protein n=1 Tax=Pseudomonas oryzihabitans TaxID=47885 RepID=UPI001F528B4A|nr:iron-containing redox enzyme family protein [Pseudomonas oryzihabitans]MCI1011310.1 iron-containing redox enzyme family protein [Pseudomonas oryzihabitans]